MSAPSSPSRVEALLREAIELEAEEIYLQAQGERAKMRYRVSGRIVQKLDGFLPDAHPVFDELKALATQGVSEQEDEWLGHFPFSLAERAVWVRVYWFRDEEEDAVVISMLDPWRGFGDLGLGQRDVATLEGLISFPHGVIVGCGVAGSGHPTTLNALLERLGQKGKRVVSLADWSDPRLQGVTQIDVETDSMGEQIELLAGHFDVFALGNLDSAEKVHAAFDLATEGSLVLGLVYSPSLAVALRRFLDSGISPELLRAQFLGGWAQVLVPRASGESRIGLFSCLSYEETRQLVFERKGFDDAEEARALWRDAEEKIAAGLIRREDATRHLPIP